MSNIQTIHTISMKETHARSNDLRAQLVRIACAKRSAVTALARVSMQNELTQIQAQLKALRCYQRNLILTNASAATQLRSHLRECI